VLCGGKKKGSFSGKKEKLAESEGRKGGRVTEGTPRITIGEVVRGSGGKKGGVTFKV